ncbi:MAG: NAD(+) synthase [Deltaproteobacteria bacterium]|nr:NAD(+) synthase [Deltaproteobacteria bacterium]
MRLIRVGAASLNQTPMDWEGNERRVREAIEAARAQGVRLLCLPELCLSGYGCEDAFHSPSVLESSWDLLARLLPATRGLAVTVGLPVLHGGALFNAVALLVDGALLGLFCKRHLAGDGVHYEPRWFKPWPEGGRATHRVMFGPLAGNDVPIGDRIVDLGGVRVGFEICEEAWVARRPGAELAARGVDVVLNPSASHFAFGKQAVRDRFVLEGSRAFGVTYVLANLMGNESGRVIYDGGCRIATGGALVARGARLSFAEVSVVAATVDVDLDRTRRARTSSFRTQSVIEDDACLDQPFPWGHPAPEAPSLNGAADEPEHTDAIFARALALALHDYTRKSRSQGWVVSLSGGADSAAVSVLCAASLQLAAHELGIDALRARFAYIPGVAGCESARALVGRMLTTVYQSTQHSGEVTRSAAEAVAAAVGARHHAWSVDTLVEGYIALASAAVGRPLAWATDDLTLQNIQARARAPGVWMLANIENKLLLATSNRSEAAVGYATMDGDTCGGLSPIAGIDKAALRRWLRWAEHEGLPELGPIPALRVINVQQPTAELRPADEGQTDESDLMPYPVLDAIERMAIRDKDGPVEVWTRLCARLPAQDPRQLGAWVRRFFQLWVRNQWKRERFAPAFHVDDENLDPKTWCRFPILCGNYAVELRDLERRVADLGAR